MPTQYIVLTKKTHRTLLPYLYAFRFVSATSLSLILNQSRQATHKTLEELVTTGYVSRIYDKSFRFNRKPAYYYLSPSGVTTVRKLLNLPEPAVHALYKNDAVSQAFKDHYLELTCCYPLLRASLPHATHILTKTEINRLEQFPKNKPDLYIKTPNEHEAIVLLLTNTPSYIVRKRIEEIISHYDTEGWEGAYPRVCLILDDNMRVERCLQMVAKKLDSLGFADDELAIFATSLEHLQSPSRPLWFHYLTPRSSRQLIE